MEKVKSEHLSKFGFFGLIVTLGIVYGDIGTSPLYVMKAIIGANAHINADYIIGAVSCIIWTLTLQTTVKYVLITLRADNKGEGGILALYALVRKSKKKWLQLQMILPRFIPLTSKKSAVQKCMPLTAQLAISQTVRVLVHSQR